MQQQQQQQQLGILGLGNPLLDEQTFVDKTFLAKFALKPNDAILADDRVHQQLFEEVAARADVEFVAGGSAQNSIRAAQWCLGPGRARTAFFGAVGDDEAAQRMRTCCEEALVTPHYQTLGNFETGKCAVLISDAGKHRSLVARLGAAENFGVEFLLSQKSFCMQNFRIFYNEGFFVTVSPSAIDLLAAMAIETRGIYATNISAEFVVLVPQFREVFLKNLVNTDFLFGNAAEFRALARGLELSEQHDLEKIAKLVAETPKTGNPQRPRTVVVTQGHEQTVVAVAGQAPVQVSVVDVPEDLIVDVNGAGDAYVGGFLAGLSEGLDILNCCRVGAECAALVIQRSGCTFPNREACPSLTF